MNKTLFYFYISNIKSRHRQMLKVHKVSTDSF